MPNSLGAKPKIDTSEFKNGIKQMDSDLRVLRTGFKATAATMVDWTKDATGLEARARSLGSQIEIQARKVAATRAEWERVKKVSGENSLAANKLEADLNNETASLNKMETELGQTETALGEMKSGTDETSESVEEMGEQVEESGSKMETFKGVVGGMAGIAAAAVTGVLALGAAAVAAVVGVSALVFKSADAAAELVDLSAKTGISTTELQELSFIGDQVGTSLDTITGAQSRLIRSMASAAEGSKSQKEAFGALGVSVVDANGNLRDQQDVFADTIDALGRIENPAERDALAMEIFGKSAQELNPLIKAGSDELARLAQEAHDVGAVMDEDTVAGLEAFDDTVASIQASVKGMLGTLAGQFLPIAQQVGDSLKALFKSPEFKAGVAEFTKLLQGFVTLMGTVLKQLLSGDLAGALASIFGAENGGKIFAFIQMISNFIQNVLIPFVTTHAEEIKAALLGIGAALGAAGIVSIIAGIVAAINPVTLIIAAIVAAVGLLSAAWTGNWGGIRDTVTTIWEGTLKPVLQTLWDWLSTNIPAALRTLSNFWTNVLLPAIQRVWSFLNTTVFPLWRAMAEFLGAVFGLALRTLSGIWTEVLLPALRGVWEFLSNNVFPIFQSIGTYIAETFRPILDSLGHFISTTLVPAFGGISGAISGVIDWLLEMADILNNLTLPDWLTPGSPTPWEIGLIGINKAMQDLNRTLPVLAKGLNLQPQGAGGVGLGGSSVTNDSSYQFFAPVIIQGETTPGSLGAALKGKRY